MSGAAWVYFLVWAFLILTPCALMGWLGYRFVTKLGQYPSKTAVLQRGVFLPYMLIAMTFITLILMFFKYFTSN